MARPTPDEEAPLTKDVDGKSAVETPRTDDPDFDPELKQYGGQFDKKFAFLQVTIRLPLDPNPLNIIALAYGFLPFIVPGTLAVCWLINHRFLPLYGLAICLVASLLNEACLKPIFNDPRPSRSANKYKDKDGKWHMKHGMPSGHVLNATLVCTWAVLEVAVRGPGYDDHLSDTLKWLIIICLLNMPVPWARIYNGDHSLNQSLVAGAIGLVLGITAFAVRITYFPNRWKPWETDDDESLIPSLAPILAAATTTAAPTVTAAATTVATTVAAAATTAAATVATTVAEAATTLATTVATTAAAATTAATTIAAAASSTVTTA